MMRKMARLAVLGVVATFVLPAALMAQYPSEVVGFNQAPLGDPTDLETREMFRDPEWSGSSAGYVVKNETGYENNASFRSDALAVEGLGCMEVLFKWRDAADPEAWVRLTTFDARVRPNPALHTQGKVRFDIVNRSQMWLGQIGLCLGIRETGAMVPQMGNGTTSGDIEWVGVDTTLSCILDGASTNGLETTVAGDDVLISTNGLEAINYGPNKVLDSVPAGDDVAYYGFFVATNGTRTPIPAIIVPVSAAAASVEWDLSTGQVSFNGGTPVGGIAPMTGNGILDAPNNRGTLEHIAVTNVITDSATGIDIGIDSLQFEAPVADPVLPPTVVAPIIADDTEVTVTDLALNVDQVVLYLNGSPIATEDVTDNDDVVFTVAPAVTGDIYTATQREGGVVSELSDGVTVLPEASPYNFAVLLDDQGHGGSESIWEWVGVTAASGWKSTGQFLFTDSSQWQAVDVPLLADPISTLPGPGGDGVLDESPEGYWTIDTVWFNIAPGADSNGMGPHEVFVDAIDLLDEFGTVTGTILSGEDGINRLSATRYQSTTASVSSSLTTMAAYDGGHSHRLYWTYPSQVDENLGVLQREGYAAGTSDRIPDTTYTLRFHLLCRAKPTNPAVALPVVTGPIVVGTQDTVRVTNSADATEVQLYVNGVAEGSPVTPTGTTTDFTGLSLTAGDSISATQVVGTNGTSDYAYPKVASAAPLPPVVLDPISPGASGVTVTNLYTTLYAETSLVEVYVNDVLAGSAPGGTATVVVPVTAIAQDDVIKATQTVNGAVSGFSNEVVANFPAPVFYMAPPANATTIRIMNLYPTATQVNIATSNGLKTFSGAPVAGETYADVPVSGLEVGDILVANQVAGGLTSPDSDTEVVTVSTITTVEVDDDFESYANQTALEAVWSKSHAQGVLLTEERDATNPVGLKSAKGEAGTTGSQFVHDPIAPSATEPIVFNVNIYDADGPGVVSNQWAELNESPTGAYSHMIHIGIVSSGFGQDIDNDYYGMRLLAPGPGWKGLDDYDAPLRSVGWHNFTVVHKGEFVDVYVDGLLSQKNMPCSNGSAQTLTMVQLGAGYATSTVGYYDDVLLEVGSVHFQPPRSQPPAPPVIVTPIVKGDEVVTLSDVDVDSADPVTEVSVYDSSLNKIGSYTLTAVDTNGVVDVSLNRALVAQELITATQTNIVGESTQSAAREVGNYNGDILISLGVREANNDIEWVGADSSTNGAPQGIAISPSDGWQTIEFDPTSDPVTGFTGDGEITELTGTLEHLAVAVDAASANRSSGPYTLYVDNVVNVVAGGTDVVIADFEGYTYGDEVLFQEPTFSGSTYPADLTGSPSASGVVTYHPAGGSGDAVLRWCWKDTTNQRWARITTSGATFLGSPAIDLTKPIRMDILLVEKPTVKGDMDGNCTIGLDDLAAFRDNCLLGPAGAINLGDCLDADFNDDGVVDLVDFAAFQRDFSNGFPVLDCVE